MNYLKEYRLSANMNQAQLAERLNVTQACISRWEHGVAYPEVDTAKKISKILGIPFDLIFNHGSLTDPHTLPIYEAITADGVTRTCTKAGCLLQISEREMRMLVPRKEQRLSKEGKDQHLILEPDRFFGYYCSASNMNPLIMKDSINIIFRTTIIYPNAVQLVSLDGEDASFARMVDGDVDIVAITNGNPMTYRHFRSSDIAEGNLKIHGVVVQTRVNFLY